MKFRTSLYLLLISFSAISAQTIQFTFQNNTNATLSEVYAAPEGVEWDFNYLGYDLKPGESFEFVLDKEQGCIVDFFAVGVDGEEYIYVNYDICSENSFVLMEEDRDVQKGTAQNNSGGSSANSAGTLAGKLSANKWMMMFNGEEYGQLTLNADGSSIKTAAGGYAAVNGTWSVDENASTLTMTYPEEGSTTGNLKDLGGEFEVAYYDGAIVWKFIKM